jgi:hypothetical protein
MQSVLTIFIALFFFFKYSSSQQLDCHDLCDYLVTYNITQTLSKSAAVTASRFCDPRLWYCTRYGSIVDQTNSLIDPDNSGLGWHSAAFAPQYIQLDLSEKYQISCVRLKVDMSPHGQTHHSLWAGDNLNQLRVVKELINETAPNRPWLNLTFNPPLDEVRYLRLTTTTSPSWIAWGKFLVYGK